MLRELLWLQACSLLRTNSAYSRGGGGGCGFVCNMAATSAALAVFHLAGAINVVDLTECQSAQQLEEGKLDCCLLRGWNDKADQKATTCYLVQPLHLLHVGEIDLRKQKSQMS